MYTLPLRLGRGVGTLINPSPALPLKMGGRYLRNSSLITQR